MSHDLRHKSRAITEGMERAPARAMLKGIGFTAEDLARPIIGVRNNSIEFRRCQANPHTFSLDVRL